MPLPDFLFVVGDSREDEYVFNWAHKQKGIRHVVTITLGARNTEASATLTQGVTGTYEVLSAFGFASGSPLVHGKHLGQPAWLS